MKRLLSIICLAVTAAMAVAQQGNAFRKVDIRAAYLHLNGDHQVGGLSGNLTGPFVWFNLDSNTSVKPAGWNFYNPLAPGWLDPSERPFFLLDMQIPAPTKAQLTNERFAIGGSMLRNLTIQILLSSTSLFSK